KAFRLTLINEEAYAAYSGMLPGLIAGHYRFQEAHIDLGQLCQSLGVRFIKGRVNGLDLTKKKVHLVGGRPAISFDALSLDIGSLPQIPNIPELKDVSIPVKPVFRFLSKLAELEDVIGARTPQLPYAVTVVGGGAGGVE